MRKIKRALLSVSNKEGIVDLSRELNQLGVEILSTGGTARMLQEEKIPVIEISDYTGFPEMLDGRLKTLHPKVHGGILGIRDNLDHVRAMKEHEITAIDLVVVNLYPFEETIARPGCTLGEAIENIDIGGPTMVRAASKNHHDVTVVVDPSDYPMILNEIRETGGTSDMIRFRMAKKAFAHTAQYDGAISNYLSSVQSDGQIDKFPEVFSMQVRKVQDLRYGENPHQAAAFFKERHVDESSVSSAEQLQGKELSFNNILDLDSTMETVKEFDKTCAAIIKHTNPCGLALSDIDLVDAYRKAKATDPVSAFGGVVGFNREVDAETAKEITSTFIEAVVAPGYTDEALEIFKSKKNLRIMRCTPFTEYRFRGYDFKKVLGGILVQDRDLGMINLKECKVVTTRAPNESEYEGLEFAWKVCKHVKSNAIVYATKDQLVGVGAGQMSRVDSSKIAVMKANLSTKGTVLASDAFFPFRDGVDAAAEAGVTAIIEPGGSIRDQEVIDAANEHNIAMVFTGMRHFRH